MNLPPQVKVEGIDTVFFMGKPVRLPRMHRIAGCHAVRESFSSLGFKVSEEPQCIHLDITREGLLHRSCAWKNRCSFTSLTPAAVVPENSPPQTLVAQVINQSLLEVCKMKYLQTTKID